MAARPSLPENTTFTDKGCEVAPACLSCPLPRCRYDVVGGARVMLNRVRDTEIEQLNAAGVPVDDIAERYAISRRSVFRVLNGRGDR